MKHFLLIGMLLLLGMTNAQQKTIKGTVFVDDNINGIYDTGEVTLPNILISNGKDITTTDKNGNYEIRAIANNLIFLIKPSGYISKVNEQNSVQFYVSLEHLNKASNFNFPLYKNKERDILKVALLGDVQVDVIDDVHHVGKLVTEELAENKPDFIVPLGDLSFDNLGIFKPLSQTLGLIGSPIFYVIGNHDLNFGGEEIELRDQSFEKVFGPSYYAFEYGNNLFLVLNNIYPIRDRKYIGKIDGNQLLFIKNFVRYKKKNHKTIKIFMHIPLDELVNKQELIEVFKPFKDVFVASGHTHTQYHNYHKREKLPAIHELVGGAVCGSWWQGTHDSRGVPFATMNDGTPKGYWFLNIDKEKYALVYKVSGAEESKQINIWVPEVNEWDTSLNKLNEPYVYANVFAADSYTKVVVNFKDDEWLPMEKYEGVAPELKRFYTLQELGRYKGQKISKNPLPKMISNHLWRIKISDNLVKGAHLLKVRAINEELQLDVKANRILWID